MPRPPDIDPLNAPDSPLLSSARRLHEHGLFVFFSYQAHFLNPLVPREWESLGESELAKDSSLLEVIDLLLDRAPGLSPGVYFPVPVSRALSSDRAADLEKLFDRFHYDLIRVDLNQSWTWRNQPVAERTKAFFLEHLGWEPTIERFYFEYRIHDGWWDKSYLEAEITPLTAVALVEEAGQSGSSASARITTQIGQRDSLDLDTFRLDERERLFCETSRTGEVLFSESLRFRLLKTVDDDLASLQVAGRRCALSWPAG